MYKMFLAKNCIIIFMLLNLNHILCYDSNIINSYNINHDDHNNAVSTPIKHLLLRNAFNAIDTEQSGFLTYDALKAVLPELMTKGTQTPDEVIDVLDKNSDGLIIFEEFTDILRFFNVENPDDTESVLKELFNEYDVEGNGYISIHGFVDFLQTLSIPLSSDEFIAIYNVTDRDNSGTISFSELLNLFENYENYETNIKDSVTENMTI